MFIEFINVWRDTSRSNLEGTFELGTMSTGCLWIKNVIKQILLKSTCKKKVEMGHKNISADENSLPQNLYWSRQIKTITQHSKLKFYKIF